MLTNKQITIFLLKAIALYAAWFVVYDLWLMKVGWLDGFLIDSIVKGSRLILEVLGYQIFEYNQTIGIDGSHGVFVGIPCDGVELMALFAGFIILFKGKVLNKLWFTSLGVLLIHLINVLRVVALILLAYYSPSAIEFNHKYTFTILLYVIVFFGWMIWVRKYSGITKDK